MVREIKLKDITLFLDNIDYINVSYRDGNLYLTSTLNPNIIDKNFNDLDYRLSNIESIIKMDIHGKINNLFGKIDNLTNEIKNLKNNL